MIYKYTVGALPFTDIDVALPADHTILHGAIQDEKFCIWALVDTKRTSCVLRFRMYCTGEPIPSAEKLTYLTTVQDGPFVGHIFIEKL
jgi:hypothetical protein